MKTLKIEIITSSSNNKTRKNAIVHNEKEKKGLEESPKKKNTSVTQYAINSSMSIAIQTLRTTINYRHSDIGRKQGDSNYQTMVYRDIEKATDILSIGQSILGGGIAGSTLGPVGAIAGVLIGATSSMLSLGFKYAERERTYQHEMFQQNNSQAYNLARSNYSLSTGRMR